MNPTDTLPRPDTTWSVLKPYWDAARNGELRIPRCSACGAFNWYPEDTCAGCGKTDFTWVKLSGRGTLFSWTVVHRALHKPMAPFQPYVAGIVTIEEDASVRMVTRFLDVDPAKLKIGMPAEVRFEDFGYPIERIGVVGPFWTVRGA